MVIKEREWPSTQLNDSNMMQNKGLYVGYDWAVYSLLDLTGLFVHGWDIQLKTVSPFEYLIYLGSNFVGPCLLCVRAAIILDWVRIFVPAGTRNALFWTSHVLLCVVITFYIALIFAENLSCIPREKIWNPLVPGGRCISQQALITAASSINLVADLTILVLPQMVIWKLHMSTSKKIGLSIIFAIALLNVAVAVIRIATSVGYLNTTDSVYQVGTVILAGFAELTLLFIVACVPSIPKTFGFLLKLYASTKSSIRVSLRNRENRSTPTDSLPSKRYKRINKFGLDYVTGTSGVGSVTSVPNGSIVRTTDFTTTEDYSPDVTGTRHLRQHPWISPPSPSRPRERAGR
ncbi:hypothetical protein F5B17DRAFT_426740 [Nemania serpens]|nr:hypothetical protein F5B17DRAFT_426740 [Nemania serpens]